MKKSIIIFDPHEKIIFMPLFSFSKIYLLFGLFLLHKQQMLINNE